LVVLFRGYGCRDQGVGFIGVSFRVQDAHLRTWKWELLADTPCCTDTMWVGTEGGIVWAGDDLGYSVQHVGFSVQYEGSSVR
jgi:hypothetical protein